MRILAVSGVDGSGKSTFLKTVHQAISSESPDLAVGTAWLRFNPKATRAGDTPKVVSTVDSEHRGHPAKRLSKRVGLSRVWIRLNARLYGRQLAWQLSSRSDLDLLLADRFVLDFLADNVGAGMLREGDVPSVARELPRADAMFVLTVSDEDLKARKDPRESLSALIARRDLYLRLARSLNLSVIDTTQPDWQERVLRELREKRML